MLRVDTNKEIVRTFSIGQEEFCLLGLDRHLLDDAGVLQKFECAVDGGLELKGWRFAGAPES